MPEHLLLRREITMTPKRLRIGKPALFFINVMEGLVREHCVRVVLRNPRKRHSIDPANGLDLITHAEKLEGRCRLSVHIEKGVKADVEKIRKAVDELLGKLEIIDPTDPSS